MARLPRDVLGKLTESIAWSRRCPLRRAASPPAIARASRAARTGGSPSSVSMIPLDELDAFVEALRKTLA
jgi:hypothetical protein